MVKGVRGRQNQQWYFDAKQPSSASYCAWYRLLLYPFDPGPVTDFGDAFS